MKNKPEVPETRKLYIPGDGKFFLVLIFSFIGINKTKKDTKKN